jgi:hypothetical protein
MVVAIALAVMLATGAESGVGGVGLDVAGPKSSAGDKVKGRDHTRGDGSGEERGKAKDRSTARVTARLIRKGLRVDKPAVHGDTDCVAHSYGQVQDFFRTHPCTALFRALLDVRDKRGNLAILAVAWVDMPDPEQARQLQQLLDRGGTGNVTELSRERGGQRFSGDYYRSTREGNTVINVQAEPVGRARAALALAELAASNIA